MVKDAEAHAEEDRKLRELVDARNRADNMIHASRKSMEDLGDKVEAQEKKDIEAAIEIVEEAIKGDDKARIEEQTKKLTEIAGKLAERVYKQTGGAEQPGQQSAGDSSRQESAKGGDENVVDAEFEEVNDDKK